jgi:hypothetical protein
MPIAGTTLARHEEFCVLSPSPPTQIPGHLGCASGETSVGQVFGVPDITLDDTCQQLFFMSLQRYTQILVEMLVGEADLLAADPGGLA